MSSHSMVRRSSVRKSITSTPQKLELEIIPAKTPNRRKSQQASQNISIRTDSTGKVVVTLGNVSSSRSRSNSPSKRRNDIYSDDSDASCSSTDSTNIERLEKKAEELKNTLAILKSKKMLKEKRDRCFSLNEKTTHKSIRGRPKVIKTPTDQQTPLVKRKRGRPRKYPIAELPTECDPNSYTPPVNQFDSTLETRGVNFGDSADESCFDRHRANAESCLYPSQNTCSSRTPITLNSIENEAMDFAASASPLEAVECRRSSLSTEDLGDVFNSNNEHVLSQAIESLEQHSLANRGSDTSASPAMHLESHNIINDRRDEEPIPSFSWNAQQPENQINMSEVDIDAILGDTEGMSSTVLKEFAATPKKMWKAKLKNATYRNETNQSNCDSEISGMQSSNIILISKTSQDETSKSCSSINKVNSLAKERVSVPKNCSESTTNVNTSSQVTNQRDGLEKMVNSGEFNNNLSNPGNNGIIHSQKEDNDRTNTENLVGLNGHENGPNDSPNVKQKELNEESSSTASSTKQCSKKIGEPTWKKRVFSQRTENSSYHSSSDDDSIASETTKRRRKKNSLNCVKMRKETREKEIESELEADNSLKSSPGKKTLFQKRAASPSKTNLGHENHENQTSDRSATLKLKPVKESSTDGGYTSNTSHVDDLSINSDAALLSLDASLFENPALRTSNNIPVTKKSIQDNCAQSNDNIPDNNESTANRELVKEPSTDGGYNSNVCTTEDPSSQNSGAASLSLDSSLLRNSEINLIASVQNNEGSSSREKQNSKHLLPVTSMDKSKPSSQKEAIRSESCNSDSSLDLNETIKNAAVVDRKECDSDDLSSSDDDFQPARTPKVVQQVDLASNVNTDHDDDSDEDDSDSNDGISVKELPKSKATQEYAPDDTISDDVSLSDDAQSVRILACNKRPNAKIRQSESSDDDNSDDSSIGESEACQTKDQKQKVYISPDDSSSDNDSSRRRSNTHESPSKTRLHDSNEVGSNAVKSSEDSDDDGSNEITHLITTKLNKAMVHNEESSSDLSSSDDNLFKITSKKKVDDKKNSLERDDTSDSSSDENEESSIKQNKKEPECQLKPKPGPFYLSPDDSSSDDDLVPKEDVKSEAEENADVSGTNCDYQLETKEEESIDIFTEAKEEVDESAIWISLSQKENPHSAQSNWFQRRLDIENNVPSVPSEDEIVEYPNKKKKKKKKEKKKKDTEASEVENGSQEKKKRDKKELPEVEDSADNFVEPRALNKKRQSLRNLENGEVSKSNIARVVRGLSAGLLNGRDKLDSLGRKPDALENIGIKMPEKQTDAKKKNKRLSTPDVPDSGGTPESSETTIDSEVTLSDKKKKKGLSTPDPTESSESLGKERRISKNSETIDTEVTSSEKKKKGLATPDPTESSESSGKKRRISKNSESIDTEVTSSGKKKKGLAIPDPTESSESSGTKRRISKNSETIDTEVTSSGKKKKGLATPNPTESSETIDTEVKSSGKKKKGLATPDPTESSESSGKKRRNSNNSETIDTEVKSSGKKKKGLADPTESSESSRKKLRISNISETTIDTEAKKTTNHSEHVESSLDVPPLKTDSSSNLEVHNQLTYESCNSYSNPVRKGEKSVVTNAEHRAMKRKLKKEERRKKKNKKKDFIPLETSASTNFGVVPLDVSNYGSWSSNADFKEKALSGDRVKRASQKHLKVVSRKRNARPV